MNKQIFVYLIVALLFINVNVFAAGEINNSLFEEDSIVLSFTFDYPTLSSIIEEDTEYERLTIVDLPLMRNEQNIIIPVKPVRVLLPFGKTIDDIIIKTANVQTIELTHSLQQKFIVLNTFDDIQKRNTFEQHDTLNDSLSVLYDNLGIQYFRGYPIVHLNIYPLIYEPNRDIADFYEQITLEIVTKESTVSPLLRNTQQDKNDIISLVDNPNCISSYINQPSIIKSMAHYDYVIITTQALLDADGLYTFQDLLSHRESQGLSSTYKTVESIISEYEGIDEKEKIRNFIIDAFTNWGTSWVLLGGDIEQVPIRYLWDFDGQDVVVSSDLYYQCLDGNYNYNEDGRWGEKYDGVDGERIDLFAEVYIGRAPVDDANDVSAFVEKTLVYEESEWGTNDFLKNHLSVGEYTWNGPGGWGAGYVERCIDYWTDYNQATHGVSSQTFDIIELYERDTSWTKQDLIQAINDGVGIINHVGHGSYLAAMKLSNSDILTLENEGKYSILYSQACHSGQFEKEDCFAEEWVTAEKKGGFAAIMNSGVGYGGTINYDGADNRFSREFFDALFSNTEQISSIGKANQDSKEDNFWRIDEIGMHMYHVYYNTNLLGDPYVKIKGSEGTIADFRWSPSYPETDDDIQFYDESTGTIISWDWRFGDGHYSSQQHPSHDYSMAGFYTVKLSIMDSKGYRISTSKEIEVRDFWSPIVKVSYNYIGVNEFTLAFSGNESFDPDGFIVNWTWDFDDGTKAYTANVVHGFPDYGEYDAKLIAEDNEGNTANHFFTVHIVPISPPENLAITGSTGGISETLYNFHVSSTDSQDLLIQYYWDWGDDTTMEWTDYYGSGMTCSQTHQWVAPGTYNIRVKAKNIAGVESDWSDEFMITIVQNDPPVVELVHPSRGIFFNNNKVLPFIRPIVFGDVTLEFSVVDGNGIEQVELYINDLKIYTFLEEPYSYEWVKDSLMPLRNQIKIIAIDASGKITEEQFYIINF